MAESIVDKTGGSTILSTPAAASYGLGSHEALTLLGHGNILQSQGAGFCGVEKSIGDAKAEAINATRDVSERIGDRLCNMEARLTAQHCETKNLVIEKAAAIELRLADTESRRLRDDRDQFMHQNLHMQHKAA